MRIALGGSAANPPQMSHRRLIESLLTCGDFDQVVWILSGSRSDKKYNIDPNHRVALTELIIDPVWKIKQGPFLTVRYDDVFGVNTPTIEWLEKYQSEYPDAKLFWYTGADSIIPNPDWNGKCQIEKFWTRGRELMKNWSFLVVPRKGYLDPEKLRSSLPSNFNYRVLNIDLPDIASSQIRQHIKSGKPIDELVNKHWINSPQARYIKKFELYK